MVRAALLSILFFFVFPLAHSSQFHLDAVVPEKPLSNGEPTLYDLITIERRATIFGDYLRMVKDITDSLGDRGVATTVLVPTNKAVLALARKPYVARSPRLSHDLDAQVHA